MNKENLRAAVENSVGYANSRTSERHAVSIRTAITSRQSPYPGYLPVAPVKSDLRVSFSGSHVQVQGLIIDQRTRILTDLIRLEIWHLSPNSYKYDHRAVTYTDKMGNYRFITDLPNRESGRDYKIYLRITHENKSYFTHLSFNHSAAFISTRENNRQIGLSGEKKNLEESLLKDRYIIGFNIALPAC